MIRFVLLLLGIFFVLALVEQGFGMEDLKLIWNDAVTWADEKLDRA